MSDPSDSETDDLPGPAELTPEEERALEALLSHTTQAEAAEACGLSAKTLRLWLRTKPHFLAAYREARREVMRMCSARLQAATVKAVQTLEAVMDEKDSPSARVSAARAILDSALRANEQEDLAERIEQLEAKQAEGEDP